MCIRWKRCAWFVGYLQDYINLNSEDRGLFHGSEDAFEQLDTLCEEVGSAGIRVAADRGGFHRLCGRTRVVEPKPRTAKPGLAVRFAKKW